MIRWLYLVLIKPRMVNEDLRRREFILNLLLLGLLGMASFAILKDLTTLLRSLAEGMVYRGTGNIVVYGAFAFFFVLYILSRVRFSQVAAYIFVLVNYLLATYTLYLWSIVLPQGLLMYALVVTMASVLISTTFSLVMTGLTSLTLIGLAIAQDAGIHQPDLYWNKEPGTVNDALVYAITLAVIALVSWLSNREIERSLQRARRSEQALKEERDSLEIKVEERTRELRQAQLEKINQLYRFAEFGRLTAGMFHDLINPLTMVSLNLEKISSKERSLMLERAVEGTKRIERFLKAARKQIQQQRELTTFRLVEEIDQLTEVLGHRLRKYKIKLNVAGSSDLQLYGNAVKFYQLMVNLIVNAIDSYEEAGTPAAKRQIEIRLTQEKEKIKITVQDWGAGIPKANLPHIFDPFFTTKTTDKGTGIGLSIAHDIVTEEFKGTITVTSQPKKGTLFTILIPQATAKE